MTARKHKTTAPAIQSKADPVERARAIVAEDAPKPTRRLTGSAHKQQREILACMMEENLASLEVSYPAGAIEHMAYPIGRLRTLLSQMKALEGWEWNVDAPLFIHEVLPDPTFALIEACRVGWEQTYPADLETADSLPTEKEREEARQEAAERQEARLAAVKSARPTTLPGAAVLARFLVEMEEGLESIDAGREFLSVLASALEALASKTVRA